MLQADMDLILFCLIELAEIGAEAGEYDCRDRKQ